MNWINGETGKLTSVTPDQDRSNHSHQSEGQNIVVIIDFKGGGMASQVSGLPHLIGTITNIDGQELSRSLLSVNAELRRRQKAIKEYNDSVTSIGL